MEKHEIKKYIETYQDSYSKEQIVSQLKNSGIDENEINEVYSTLNDRASKPSDVQHKGNAKLGLVLIMIGLFIPLLGFVMIIYGIVLGFKARKINKDGFSLFVIIFGFVGLFLAALIQFFIIGMITYAFVDFGSLLPNKVDIQSSQIRGDPTGSYFNDNELAIGFSHTGPSKFIVNGSKSRFSDIDGNECLFEKVSNDITNTIGDEATFLTGHLGTIFFKCDNIEEDILEGTVTITTINTKNNAELSNTGSIRLTVQ